MARHTEIVTMDFDCQLVLSALVAAPINTGLALAVVVLDSRIASVIPELRDAREIVELRLRFKL